MANIVLTGDTSGAITIAAPAAAGTNTLTLPAETGTILTSNTSTGKILQVVNFQTSAVATGTTLTPNDDTIPQNTEGTEFMTLAITPTSASSKLKIDVATFICGSDTIRLTTALFQDSTANALAAVMSTPAFANIGGSGPSGFTHYMTAGTTSATTFKVRIGGNSSVTITLNGQSGTRRFGGVASSSITITEVAA
tara:strand:+ start:433 stop:1017 length:585 start_codon:yes stop_codon:yes gene_type:complete